MQKQPVVLDIASSSFKANPYGLLAELRDCAPVARMSAGPGQDYWLVTCYELVQRVLNDPAFACDPRNAGDASAPGPFNDCDEVVRVFVQGGLLFSDPPRHTRLRRLVNKAFTVPVVEQLRPQIAQLCSELLDQFASRSHVDLVKDFATPLPAMVICNLLGRSSERLRALAGLGRRRDAELAVSSRRGCGQVLTRISRLYRDDDRRTQRLTSCRRSCDRIGPRGSRRRPTFSRRAPVTDLSFADCRTRNDGHVDRQWHVTDAATPKAIAIAARAPAAGTRHGGGNFTLSRTFPEPVPVRGNGRDSWRRKDKARRPRRRDGECRQS